MKYINLLFGKIIDDKLGNEEMSLTTEDILKNFKPLKLDIMYFDKNENDSMVKTAFAESGMSLTKIYGKILPRADLNLRLESTHCSLKAQSKKI